MRAQRIKYPMGVLTAEGALIYDENVSGCGCSGGYRPGRARAAADLRPDPSNSWRMRFPARL